jgi:hypothetical protein
MKIKAKRGNYDVYACYVGVEVDARCSDKASAAQWMAGKLSEGGHEVSAVSDVTEEDVAFFAA